MLTVLIIVVVLAVIFGIANGVSKNNEQAEVFKKEGINPLKFIPAGKYISGHTAINASFENATLYVKDDIVKIYGTEANAGLKKFYANITTVSISGISVEDESSIQTRVGLKRLIALGVFAFAVKKKEKKELAYVIIEWTQGKFNNETVFEFEGAGALNKANACRNRLINVLSGTNQNEENHLDNELVDYINAGMNLIAVKHYMDTTGATLIDSKRHVDSLRARLKEQV
jgi:hypothetical protein